MICQSCNHENKPGAKFCGNCGGPLSAMAAPTSDEGVRRVGREKQRQQVVAEPPPESAMLQQSPALPEKHVLAPVLSLIIPGGGQLYLNDAQKGFVLLAVAAVLGYWFGGYAWFAVALWAAYDAHQTAAGGG